MDVAAGGGGGFGVFCSREISSWSSPGVRGFTFFSVVQVRFRLVLFSVPPVGGGEACFLGGEGAELEGKRERRAINGGLAVHNLMRVSMLVVL